MKGKVVSLCWLLINKQLRTSYTGTWSGEDIPFPNKHELTSARSQKHFRVIQRHDPTLRYLKRGGAEARSLSHPPSNNLVPTSVHIRYYTWSNEHLTSINFVHTYGKLPAAVHKCMEYAKIPTKYY